MYLNKSLPRALYNIMFTYFENGIFTTYNFVIFLLTIAFMEILMIIEVFSNCTYIQF